MTLDRKDYKSAIPQLEKRIAQVEKICKEVQNKFDDIAHQTQLDAAEAEKKVLALDYQMTTTRVQMEYQLQTTGLDPVEANWQTTMPSITYNSYQGKTLWYRSKTYVNDIVVQTTEPMTVNLMDGVYSFVNTVSGNTGWTTIDGDTIQTGKITSHDGNCYFDIDNNNFQMKDNSTLASSTSALAWDNGQLYIKGKIAIGNSTTDKKYYTQMTGGGFDIVANNVTLAHIGYGQGYNKSGQLVDAPFYTLGTRATGSAVGNYSLAEGVNITASGYASHAEGYTTTASGYASHAEGMENTASGNYSHVGGFYNSTSGIISRVDGIGLVSTKAAQTVIGIANIEDTNTGAKTIPLSTYTSADCGKYAFIIGNGTVRHPLSDIDDTSFSRSNAFTVDWDGNIKAGGLDCGKVSITPVADKVTSKAVKFSHTFSSAPNVVATAESAYPNAVSEVTVSKITTTGFTMNLLRTTNQETNIFWIALL